MNPTATTRTAQRGITFIGMLFVGAIVGITFVIGAQVLPTFVEYRAILKAVKKASEGSSVSEIRSIYERATDIDDMQSVKPKDLEITKEGERVVVSFAYNKEIHLVGPAYLLLKYSGSSR